MKILAIEDCFVTYYLLEGILKDCQIDKISSFKEALNINYSDYKLIFLDLHLESYDDDITRVESGIPIYQHIRKYSNLPIIFFTADSYDSFKSYISEDKNAYYLSKYPPTETSLIDLVNAITRL
jgi:CheY-like chemotaxis protein